MWAVFIWPRALRCTVNVRNVAHRGNTFRVARCVRGTTAVVIQEHSVLAICRRVLAFFFFFFFFFFHVDRKVKQIRAW